MNRRVTPRQAANWVDEGSGAPFFGIPRLVPPITFRKRLRGALPRSRARGRRAQTRQHTPQAPAEQPRSHAQAPAEDDPQRSHTGSGAHAPAASCPRARRAGQPSIASRKKALSGRVTPLLSKSGCISSPGIPLMLVNLKVAIMLPLASSIRNATEARAKTLCQRSGLTRTPQNGGEVARQTQREAQERRRTKLQSTHPPPLCLEEYCMGAGL